MKKAIPVTLIPTIILATLTTPALGATLDQRHCDAQIAMSKARTSAFALELISFGSRPISAEVYPMNSQYGGYDVVLSYSGVQRSYFVRVDYRDCAVTQISLAP